MLHDCRCVDEAKHPVAENQRVHHLPTVVVVRMNGDVANPVAGQGEVLGVRCNCDGPLVGQLGERVDVLVEQDLAVRLVADEEDFGPEFCRLSAQQMTKRLNERRRIHGARRIVW